MVLTFYTIAENAHQELDSVMGVFICFFLVFEPSTNETQLLKQNAVSNCNRRKNAKGKFSSKLQKCKNFIQKW